MGRTGVGEEGSWRVERRWLKGFEVRSRRTCCGEKGRGVGK